MESSVEGSHDGVLCKRDTQWNLLKQKTMEPVVKGSHNGIPFRRKHHGTLL